MSPMSIFLLALVAVASAAPSQPEQAQNSVQPGQSPQNVQVVGQSPVIQGVSEGQLQPPQVVSGIEQPVHHQGHSYYSPSGLITVVNGEQVKPVVGGVRQYASEQYGQPESASIPPNYKPFGSWGLYIGGNPADGYYTNYYKALGNSVDKQQAGETAKPVGQTAAFSPFLKQASSSPYVGGDYYPFAYSQSDLSLPAVHPQQVPAHSPVQAGAQVYGSPASFDSNYAAAPVYADSYATKKVGAAYAQKEISSPQTSKGYQSRVYVYPPVAASPASAVAQQAVSQQQHVVAYPVPVGSQIVGSQPGVDGAFNPYGIHAFTRYAVKPTVVSQEPSYYYSVHGQNQQASPVYKSQGAFYSAAPVVQSQGSQVVAGHSYYPLGYYGYPLNQLHYSQGSIVPSVHGAEHQHAPIASHQVENVVAENKPEKEEKQVAPSQKRA